MWHITPTLALGCLGPSWEGVSQVRLKGGPHTVYNNSMTPMLDVAQASSENYSTSNLTLKYRLNELYIVLNEMNTDQESAMRFNPLFERL